MIKQAFGQPLPNWLYRLGSFSGEPTALDLIYEDGSRAVSEEYAETVTVPYLEERIEYVQNTRDTYLERRSTWKSRESWVGEQERTYRTSIEIRKGRAPATPSTPRRMNVYARWGPEEEGTMEEPALVVYNANIIDWEDAEQILGLVRSNRLNRSYDVALQLVVAGNLAGVIHTGQRIRADSIVLPDGTVVPVRGEMYVYAHDVTKDERGAVSVVELRGKA